MRRVNLQIFVRIFCILCIPLLFATCQSQEPREEQLSISERQRRSLPPEAAQQLFKAQQAYQQGAYRYALALTDSVEQYNPVLTDVHFLRGRIFTALNFIDKAIGSYQKVLDIDSTYTGVRYNLGNIYYRQGKNRKAIEMYHKEQTISPASRNFLQLGRAYNSLGVPDSAKWAYEQAIALDGSNATAYMWLGQLYEDEGQIGKALEYSRQGLEMHPDRLNYKFIIASQLVQAGNPEEAIPYLETVVKNQPWHYGAHYNLGMAFTRIGKEEQGREYLDIADSLQQVSSEIQELELRTERQPENFQIWVDLAENLQASGRLEEALQAYQNAEYLQPWNLPLQNNIAILITEMGDTSRAIARYKSIIRRNPNIPDVWFNLGVVYANIGSTAQAKQAWERTLKLNPEHEIAQSYLARLNTTE